MDDTRVDRRGFLQASAAMAAGLTLAPSLTTAARAAIADTTSPITAASTAHCKWGAYAYQSSGQTAVSAYLHFEQLVGRKLGITRHYEKWNKTLPGTAIDWSGLTGHTPYVEWHATGAVPWTAIAAGKQDAWITAQAKRIAAAPYRMFFCFHHEPEDEPKLGTPRDFAAAYARIKRRFDAAGATNLTWVVSLMSSTFNGYHGGPDAWLPPDFDLLGTGAYNRYPCVSNRTAQPWTSFADIIGPAHAKARSLHKGMFIGEYGSVEQTANGNTNGDPRAKGRWISAAAATLKSWPEVKGVAYSHTAAHLDGFTLPYWVNTSRHARRAFRAMGQDPYFA
jgi:hypothetical protein